MRYAQSMYPAPERVVDRIKQRVDVTPVGCWLWPGATSSGYGRIAWSDESGTKRWGAVHRVMWSAVNGPIPDGLDIDHQCHDPATCEAERALDCQHRRCCNPDHLKAMTRRDNLLRGGGVTAERAAVTHCPAGHSYDAENTLVDKIGRRTCRACSYERNRAYYWAHREQRKAYNKARRAKRRGETA